MRYLQGLNLTDAQGNITLQKVDSALKNIQRLRSANGTNAAKSLGDDHIAGLTALRDDLLRQTNTGLGRSAGSATAQNLATQNLLSAVLPGKVGAVVGSMARPEVIGAGLGSLLGNEIAGGAGAAAGAAVGGGLGRIAANAFEHRGAAVRAQLDNLLTNPELYSAPRTVGRQNLSFENWAGPAVVPGSVLVRNKLSEPVPN